jgi:hypothetical protein
MAFIAYIDEYSAQKVVSLGHGARLIGLLDGKAEWSRSEGVGMEGVLKDVMLSYLIERPSYTRS